MKKWKEVRGNEGTVGGKGEKNRERKCTQE